MRNESDNARILKVVIEKLTEEFNMEYDEVLDILMSTKSLDSINSDKISVEEAVKNLYNKGCYEITFKQKLIDGE